MNYYHFKIETWLITYFPSYPSGEDPRRWKRNWLNHLSDSRPKKCSANNKSFNTLRIGIITHTRSYRIIHHLVFHFVVAAGSGSSGRSGGSSSSAIRVIAGVGQMHAGRDCRAQIVTIMRLAAGSWAEVAQCRIGMQHGRMVAMAVTMMRPGRWWRRRWQGGSRRLTVLCRVLGAGWHAGTLVRVAGIVWRIGRHIGDAANHAHARYGAKVGGQILQTLHRNAAIQARHAALWNGKCIPND